MVSALVLAYGRNISRVTVSKEQVRYKLHHVRIICFTCCDSKAAPRDIATAPPLAFHGRAAYQSMQRPSRGHKNRGVDAYDRDQV